MKIFTLGYQGLNLDQYIASLAAANVAVVIDVRETAWSYKPGFSKGPLREGLKAAGIEYIHVKAAGNPSKNRKTARSSAECLSRYRRHLVRNPECLEILKEILAAVAEEGKNACLTCFEKDPVECHRSILVDALFKRVPGLSPVHLFSETKVLKTA